MADDLSKLVFSRSTPGSDFKAYHDVKQLNFFAMASSSFIAGSDDRNGSELDSKVPVTISSTNRILFEMASSSVYAKG